MNISVVIPLLNEEESIKELYDWIAVVLQSIIFHMNLFFIDDGSIVPHEQIEFHFSK